MRNRLTVPRRLAGPATLLLAAWALPACADPATSPADRAPLDAPPAAPSAARVALPGRDAPRALLRVLSVLDLGTLPAPHVYRSEAWRINARGQVIGMSSDADGAWSYERPGDARGRAFQWEAGRMTDLNAAYFVDGMIPRAIANDGAVVYDWGSYSFRWAGFSGSLGAGPTGCVGIRSMDTNDAALVAGYVDCISDERSPALRVPGSAWQRLSGRGATPRAGDRFETAAHAINRVGDVAGGSPAGWAGSEVLPTLWTAPAYDRLVIDCRPGCVDGWARDVNDRRWVVGVMYDGGAAAYRAFLWTPTGSIERIPPLAGDTHNAAYGIDGWNRVVGYSWGGGVAPRAFVWTRRDGAQPLGELPGAAGSKAFSINSSGQIVGSSGSYRLDAGAYYAYRTRAARWQLESVIVSILSEQTVIRSSLANLRILLLGAPGFDPRGVDVGSLRLGDEIGQDTPPALDGKGSPIAFPMDANGDGLVDLVVEFSIPAMVKSGDLPKESGELLLTGNTGQGLSLHGAVKIAVAP